MAMMTILEIQQDILSQGGNLVMSSRFKKTFTTSAVLYRVIFSQHQWSSVMRLRFLLTVKNRSYQEDNHDHLLDFLDINDRFCSPVLSMEQLIEPSAAPELTKLTVFCTTAQATLLRSSATLQFVRLIEFKKVALQQSSDEACDFICSTAAVPGVDECFPHEISNVVAMLESKNMILSSRLSFYHDLKKTK